MPPLFIERSVLVRRLMNLPRLTPLADPFDSLRSLRTGLSPLRDSRIDRTPATWGSRPRL
jgi:hypothetical protein